MSDIVLLAHRGSNPYPDHSREAYVWAVNWGADFIEPDLYLTKDGVLVASHDDHNYANLTYAEAKAIEPALMTFGEVIEIAKAMSVETGRKIGIVPETKNTSYATSEALIEALIAHDFTDPALVTIQSFNPANLQQLHDTIMPQYGVDVPLAYLRSGIGNPTEIATFADMVAPVINSFTAADVAAAHAAGLKVVAWTIMGSKADVQKYVDMGVDAIFVDDTRLARESIAEIGGAKAAFGTANWDVLTGSAGADILYAMQGNDLVRAGDGADVVYGDGGNDVLFGGAGDDELHGGAGGDFLSGGEGADTLIGGTGNDVIVATGDRIVFRAGDGIDLVILDSTSTLHFDGILPADIVVLRDGNNLIVRSGSDAIILRDGVDPAHQPAAITTSDGLSLTGAELAALAVPGSDAEIAALLPGLEAILAAAPGLAEPSQIALGTDLVSEGDFSPAVLARQIEGAENGAVYRLSFSLADLPIGDDGVVVTWGGEVVYQGTPSAAGEAFSFIVKGGSGDGSNLLAFAGAGTGFGAELDGVHFVKVAEPALPSAGNAAPEAGANALRISQDMAYRGQVAAGDADGDALVYSLLEGPAHGTLAFNLDGSYRYTPSAGFTGADRFSVLVNDGHGGVAEAVISLDVVPGIVVGTDLVANGSFEDVSASTGNNGPSDWGYRNPNGIIAGWTDINGNRIEQHWDSPNGVVATDGRIWLDMDGYNTNTHIVQQVARIEDGATYLLSFSLGDADTAVSDDGIRVVWNGQLVYEGVPTNPWQTLSFRVTGGSGDASNRLEFIATGTGLNTYGAALDDIRLVKIAEPGTPPAENTAPDALDGAASGTRGNVVTGQLAATDADGDVPLTFALGQGPAHGTVEIDADGSYRYTPAAGYVGQDSFTFTVSDGFGGTDTATLSLTIAPSTAVGPELIVNGGFEDLTGANDGAAWGYRNTNPAGVIPGWVNTGDNRAEIHRDTVGGIGALEGSYWFDMEGAPKNARLVQTVAGVSEGETYRLKFAIADTDTAQASDTVAVYWGGQVIYTGIPKNKWQEITIDVVGGAGDGSNKLEFASTTVNPNGAGVALDKVSMVWIDQNPNLIVNGSFEDLTGASNGNWSGDWGYRNDNGIIAGWTQLNGAGGGRAELHFDTQNGVGAKDGNVWFDMDGNGNNAKLVQKVAGVETGATYRLSFFIADADARTSDDGVRVYWGGQIVYEGIPGNSWLAVTIDVVGGAGDGSNELIFQGTETNLNGYGAALDDISLRKIADAPPPNAVPVAADDAGLGTAYGAALVIDPAALLANDTDADGDTLVIQSVAAGIGGSVALDAEGRIVFTPADGFSGEASFAYTVFDGKGGTASATVTVTVAPYVPVGTPGDDALVGTVGDEVILAGAGDDLVQAGAGNDVVDGGDGDDELHGEDGDDVLKGGAGDDLLFGGAGDDVLAGGAEDDRLDGGDGSDTADYSDDTAGVTVDLSQGIAFGDESGEDELISIENVIGGAGNDTLIGDDGANRLVGGAGDDVILAGGGDDLIVAGAGHDVIDGGDGFDTLDLSAATGAISVDFAAGKASGEGIGTNSFSNIEKLLFGAGNDVVTGGNGDDAFDGGAGNDTLKGGAGNDTLWGGEGDDSLDGGSGDDDVFGGTGNDVIRAGSGNDLVEGGEGDDVIDAGSGDDLVRGGEGRDVIDGGSGDDRIEGGAGDDILTGGSGHDVFVFAVGFGKDVITDFKTSGSSSDVLEFSVGLFADFEAAMESAAQLGADTVFTVDADTTLTLKGIQLSSLAQDDFRFA